MLDALQGCFFAQHGQHFPNGWPLLHHRKENRDELPAVPTLKTSTNVCHKVEDCLGSVSLGTVMLNVDISLSLGQLAAIPIQDEGEVANNRRVPAKCSVANNN
ncbi:hypothetical protein E2C01_017341 [Portunus trituberculatus]|uniref:Uncharacterized protein n=1 Tax=Portunus trituberculatus TaxID=210409 RepID=A0A5B7DRD0_PORTR|nr:hypothetical protein [Portunus trituberculatus]